MKKHIKAVFLFSFMLFLLIGIFLKHTSLPSAALAQRGFITPTLPVAQSPTPTFPSRTTPAPTRPPFVTPTPTLASFPTLTPSQAPPPGRIPPSDPVLVGAGDIAVCDSDGDEKTAALLDNISGTVFTLGDNVYEDGTYSEFVNCYGPSWGRHKSRTKPSLGNHEYHTPGASGYFQYFGYNTRGTNTGYYSYNLGSWHIIVLNSNCSEVGGCETGSPQERWLRADLAANPTQCTLAYFHHPLFSSGAIGSDVRFKPFWQAMYQYGVDVVLNGHDHDYERFAPQTPDGVKDVTRGIQEFIVGTGGVKEEPFWDPPLPTTEVRNNDTHGVLKLTLHPASYEWEFFPENGKTFSDKGSASCH